MDERFVKAKWSDDLMGVWKSSRQANKKEVSSSVKKNTKQRGTPTNGNEWKTQNSPAPRDGKSDGRNDHWIGESERRRYANAGKKCIDSMSLIG
jgi:hypothetical protein